MLTFHETSLSLENQSIAFVVYSDLWWQQRELGPLHWQLVNTIIGPGFVVYNVRHFVVCFRYLFPRDILSIVDVSNSSEQYSNLRFFASGHFFWLLQTWTFIAFSQSVSWSSTYQVIFHNITISTSVSFSNQASSFFLKIYHLLLSSEWSRALLQSEEKINKTQKIPGLPPARAPSKKRGLKGKGVGAAYINGVSRPSSSGFDSLHS